MPKLVIGLAILLMIADILWYGVRGEEFERLWRQSLDRPSGSMAFRFILQLLMAVVAATHDGLKDARGGRTPYLWTIARHSRKRVGRLREGLTATARIVLLGLAIDLFYQILVFWTFYPNEAVIIALLLAFIPYLVIRGPITRIARLWRGGASGGIR
jgi:hypothetical protein